jgi:hypothetical protein
LISYLVTQHNNSIFPYSNLSFQCNVNKSESVEFREDIQNMRENYGDNNVLDYYYNDDTINVINDNYHNINDHDNTDNNINDNDGIRNTHYLLCHLLHPSEYKLNSTQLSALLHCMSTQINRYVPHLSVSLS